MISVHIFSVNMISEPQIMSINSWKEFVLPQIHNERRYRKFFSLHHRAHIIPWKFLLWNSPSIRWKLSCCFLNGITTLHWTYVYYDILSNLSPKNRGKYDFLGISFLCFHGLSLYNAVIYESISYYYIYSPCTHFFRLFKRKKCEKYILRNTSKRM